MLTPHEIRLIGKSADLWNDFMDLESKDSDRKDFMDAIHRIQHIIMARSTHREHPFLFTS